MITTTGSAAVVRTPTLACPNKRIAVIWRHVSGHVLGSLVEGAGKYADTVYVALDSPDCIISNVASPGCVEPVYTYNGDLSYAINQKLAAGPCEIVLLNGDGSDDPKMIPGLFAGISHGYDVVIGPPFDSATSDAILVLNNKPLIDQGSGFMALSRQALAGFKATAGPDLACQLLEHAKEKGFKIKCMGRGEASPEELYKYRIGVVVPAYNEELLIGDTIRSIPSYISRIYVIDDCSSDHTSEILGQVSDPRVVSLRHEKNKGVGAAIISGYKLALKDGMEIVAVMAGDNQMDPEQLPRLLKPVLEGKADYAKGNRLINCKFRKGMSKWRSFGNFLLTMITKVGSGYWGITDPQNGYTAISRSALEAIDLDAVYPYYGYCNDFLIKMNAFGLRTVDVAIPARYGREKSSIKYSRFIMKVAPMIWRGFLWRLKMKYVVMDFHPLVLFYAAGMVLLPVGLLMDAWAIVSLFIGGSSAAFQVIAALFTLTGLQLLLAAMLLDRQAEGRDKQ
ncbi:MAG TPA: glycosyltransferase [Methanocellaceae archaeon]